MEKTFKVLGDKTRMDLLLIIHQIPNICLCHLEQCFSLSTSNLSRHLKELAESNLLTVIKEGKWKYYTVSDYGQNYVELIHKLHNQDELQHIINLSSSLQRDIQC